MDETTIIKIVGILVNTCRDSAFSTDDLAIYLEAIFEHRE